MRRSTPPPTKSVRPSTLVVIVLMLVGVVLGRPGLAAADGTGPGAGSVVYVGDGTAADLVRFYFPPTVSYVDAQARVIQAAAAAHVPDRGVTFVDEVMSGEGPVVELATTVSHRVGRLGRLVDVPDLERLDPFGQHKLYASLPDESALSGANRPRLQEEGDSTNLYRLTGPASFEYRYQQSFLWTAVVLALLLAVLPWWIARVLAARVERKALDAPAKLKALRRRNRWILAVTAVAFLIVLVGMGIAALPPALVAGVAPDVTRSPAVNTAVAVAPSVALALVCLFGIVRATQPAYRRIRGITVKPPFKPRKAALVLTVGLAPLAILWATVFVLTRFMSFTPLVFGAGLMASLIVTQTVLPVVLLAALETRPLDPATGERLMGLCRSQGLRLRDVRQYNGRDRKSANAFFIGLLPHRRHVVVSDYLLDTFPAAEVDAVVCHEIGHGKHHDTATRFAILMALYTLFAIPHMVTIGCVGLIGSGLWTIPLRRRAERRADDYAASQIGAATMASALQRLAEVNTQPLRSGRITGLFKSHPDIATRINRLTRVPTAHAATPAPTASTGALR